MISTVIVSQFAGNIGEHFLIWTHQLTEKLTRGSEVFSEDPTISTGKLGIVRLWKEAVVIGIWSSATRGSNLLYGIEDGRIGTGICSRASVFHVMFNV